MELKNTNQNQKNDQNQKNYMHVPTGSVDTYEQWIKDVSDEELENEPCFDNATDLVDSYIDQNILIEVEEKDGEWKEV